MATAKDLQKTNGNKPMTVKDLIAQNFDIIKDALPKAMTPERLAQLFTITIRKTPALLKCTPESLVGALFQCAVNGLEPNGFHAAIIPFSNNRKMGSSWVKVNEAQFQIMYQGLIDLFYRHPLAQHLHFDTVCENDEFDYEYGSNAFLRHKPALMDRGEVKAFYAEATLKNGGYIFAVEAKQSLMDHGQKFSKNFENKNSTWKTNADAMCLKTIVKMLMKQLPKSAELSQALIMDETIKTRVDRDMLAVPDETDWEKADDQEEIEAPDQPEEMPQDDEPKAETKNNAYKTMLERFKTAKECCGDTIYYAILSKHNIQHANSIRSVKQGEEILSEMAREHDKIQAEGSE